MTGAPEKAGKWKKKYDIPNKNVYNYETFDQIADNKDIDTVLIRGGNEQWLHDYGTIRITAVDLADAETDLLFCVGSGLGTHLDPVGELFERRNVVGVGNVSATDDSYALGATG